MLLLVMSKTFDTVKRNNLMELLETILDPDETHDENTPKRCKIECQNRKRILWKDYNKYWCTTRVLPEPNFIHIIPSRGPQTERSTVTEHNYSKIPINSEDLLQEHLKDHTHNLLKENGLLIHQQYADDTRWVTVNVEHRKEKNQGKNSSTALQAKPTSKQTKQKSILSK